MILRVFLIAAGLLCALSAAVCFADEQQARDARKAWDKADTETARESALEDLVASDCKLAAEFLADLLKQDAKAPQGGKDDLSPALRATVVAAMCKLKSDECMETLTAAASALDSDKDHALALEQCDLLTAVAANTLSEKAAAAIRDLLTKQKSPWLALATVEAIRAAELHTPGSGIRFHDEVLALLGEKNDKLLTCDLLTVNIFACLKVLTQAEQVRKVVRALIDWQAWSQNTLPRLHGLADDLLFYLTKESCTLTDQTIKFWEWWLGNAGDKEAKKPRVEYAPFIAPTIGNRTVFVLDTSSSMGLGMSETAKEGVQKKARDEGLTLPWDRINTKLDLARELLIDAIGKLEPRPELDEQDRPRFAIVTYSKNAKCVTGGWLSADAAGRDEGIEFAKAIKLDSTTNIHGGLLQAFEVSDAGVEADHPAHDADCVVTGAHSIVFLTDGFATWSNDSDKHVPDPRNPNGTVGDGALVKPESILAEIARLNRFRKVRINTFGIGNYDRELLTAIAAQSYGYHVDWAFKEEQKGNFEPVVEK